MIIDANALDCAKFDDPFDAVIVGAGTVGLVIASRLLSAGLRVAVIEAGGRVASAVGEAGGAASVGQAHLGTTIGRALGLGGTSALWGGQLAEFVEEDLLRAEHPWPITYSELQHWYDRTYDELGLPKRKSDAAYRSAFNIPEPAQGAVEHFFTFWLPQPNLAYYYKTQITQSSALSIFLNLSVNAFKMQNDRATAVSCVTRAGKCIEISTKNIVCAAGTIGNVRLLLSTGRSCDVPWRTNGNVGRYFQDHIGATVADVEVLDDFRFRSWFENGFALGRKLQPKLRHAAEVRAALPINVCGFFTFRSSAREQIGNVKNLVKSLKSGLAYSQVRTLPNDILKIGTSLAPLVWRYVKDHRILALYDLGIEFMIQSEQLPVARSEIRVTNDHPLIDGLLPVAVDWQVEGSEIDAIRRFTLDASDFLESNGLAKLKLHHWLLGADDLRAHAFFDTNHQCGGLRMGLNPDSSVTDSDCRIWGTRNIFVAGASVFPTSSYANCTLTGLALGVRLADLITCETGRRS